jgi:hypothetical protein
MGSPLLSDDFDNLGITKDEIKFYRKLELGIYLFSIGTALSVYVAMGIRYILY